MGVESKSHRPMTTNDDSVSVAVIPEVGACRGHVGLLLMLARNGLSEGGAGNQRDQRESSDKRFHDASPCCGRFVRDFLQQRQADGRCCAVIKEIGSPRLPDELYFGIDCVTQRSTPSYFGLGLP